MPTITITGVLQSTLFIQHDLSVEIAASELTPGSSIRFDVADIKFPLSLRKQGNNVTEIPINTWPSPDSYLIGNFGFSIENNLQNYEDGFIDLGVSNFVVREQEGPPQPPVEPCLFDSDGNGFVTIGDIQKAYDNAIGLAATTPELQNLDIDDDGFVTIQDMYAAYEFEGWTGCVDPPILSDYPRYLDTYDTNITFGVSLRKLRSSYTGPCMTVFLDVDKRGICLTNIQTFWTRAWRILNSGEYDKLGQLGRDALLVGDDGYQLDVWEKWVQLKADYPWLDNRLEIGFTEDGYYDYEKILLFMSNPPAALGITLTAEEEADFNYRYKTEGQGIWQRPFEASATVLIEEWHDQGYSNNGFVATSGLEHELRYHPYTKNSLMVGKGGNIISYQDIPVVGIGSVEGLGDAAWDLQPDIPVPNQSINGYGYPPGAYNVMPSSSSSDYETGWKMWSTNEYVLEATNKDYWNAGAMYLVNKNPVHYSANESEWVYNEFGKPSYSNGKRSGGWCGITGIGSGEGAWGIRRGSANEGSDQHGSYGFGGGWSDVSDPNNDPANGGNGRPYASISSGGSTTDSSTGNTTDHYNVWSPSAESIQQDPIRSMAKVNKYGEKALYGQYAGINYHLGNVTFANGYPATYTFNGFDTNIHKYTLGLPFLYFGSMHQRHFQNTQEYILWDELLPDEFVEQYIQESKSYFSNKKI